MRVIPGEAWATWKSGQFVGPNRPICRATLQRSVVLDYEGAWRSLVFGQDLDQLEIPNILTVNIDNRNTSDAAEMVMTLSNVTLPSASDNLDLTHSGDTPATTAGPSRRTLRDLGFPGYYTYNRGVTQSSAVKWGHGINYEWMDAFIPNRVIRTWQGYGTDGAADPWDDEKLTLTGTWLIDTVKYSANGTISIKCRDFAKLLIEQRLYPPIVPLDKYPVRVWTTHDTQVWETSSEIVEKEIFVPGEGIEGANVATFGDSSSSFYFSSLKGSCGHNPPHAFDGDLSTYWLSVSNGSQTATWSYEWIEANTGGNPVNRIKFHQKLGGGYQLYVSVKVGGTWQGTEVVPYDAGSVGAPNESDIEYVLLTTTPAESGWVTVDLPAMYSADAVRITFHTLTKTSTCATPFANNYRVAVSEFQAMAFTVSEDTTVITEEEIDTSGYVTEKIEGNIRDYTDIVKLFTAWAGFYWPDGTPTDWVIENWSDLDGRVWGDFEYSGAYPVDPPELDASYWDNKSVMDGINQIREILGFIFYVDATGGIIWRSPNIWKKGNFITGVGYIDGEDTIETVDEDTVLIDYGVTLSDEALRSEVVIVGADPGTDLWASVRPGYAIGENVPEAGDMSDLRLLGGQERVSIIPDYPFQDAAELEKFGYLLTLWMHWSFRRSSFRIPGNAAFEPDDQVRIYERVTSEAYVHYIEGVKSSMDLGKGTWYLDIDTHWLGEGPSDKWVIDYEDMAESSPALYAYLVANNRLSEEDTGVTVPEIDVHVPEFEFPRIDVDDELFPEPPPILAADDDYESESGPEVVSGGDGNIGLGQRGSYSWTKAHWGPRCASQGITRLVTAGDYAGQTDTINIQTHTTLITARVWYGVREIIKDLGIKLHGSDPNRVGCYNCRLISGSTKWSNHSWGIAIDINHYLNNGWGYFYKGTDGRWYYGGGKLYGSSPPPADSDATALHNSLTSRLKCNNIPVFRWGGNWTNIKDYMHYEVIVTPAEIRQYGVKLDGVGLI